MSKHINGIGGFFFRAENPENLKSWYIETLGIDIQNMVWQQESGPTVFEPFSKNTDYFSKDKMWMINFRVSNLKSFIEELKKNGVEVEEREEWNSMPEIGIFARVHDPEGNAIELWEPAEK
ncbi:VOC family protein [Leptospira ognonensis]|uniref:VOC family protein n=1 Tax=Leptospira ognonensis TaxID=2484945 RepID=A0A4R9K829_9LEPT|nr:VOC family protein [Leptospira ognonensis]TGL61530.1 VOC family protein [Leptospira ognonensis]